MATRAARFSKPASCDDLVAGFVICGVKESMEACLSAFWVCVVVGASGGRGAHRFASETDRGDHGEREAGEGEKKLMHKPLRKP